MQKIKMVLGSETKINTIYVDGGFASNSVFVKTIEELLPGFIIIPSEMPLGTSLGAAMMLAYDYKKTAPVY